MSAWQEFLTSDPHPGEVRFKLDENLPSELAGDLGNLGHNAGVVLFRPDTLGRRAVITFVRERLEKILEMDLNGRLTVVGPYRIRFR